MTVGSIVDAENEENEWKKAKLIAKNKDGWTAQASDNDGESFDHYWEMVHPEYVRHTVPPPAPVPAPEQPVEPTASIAIPGMRDGEWIMQTEMDQKRTVAGTDSTGT